MIRRLLTGLAAGLGLGLGLLGLPTFLLGAHRALAPLMPTLGELPGVLLAPGDGGLFLLLLFGIGWVCWAVLITAFTVEVIARARGIRTPHLGVFFPQVTVARAVSAVALLLTLTPTAATALTAHSSGPPPRTAPSAAAAQPAPDTQPQPSGTHNDADTDTGEAHVDYRVERGDTLWDIADEQLEDPTRYPEIAQASQDITQPDGRHLGDPDLILPGWTLHIPTNHPDTTTTDQPDDPQATAAEGSDPPAAQGRDPGVVVPPTTPLHTPSSTPGHTTGGGGGGVRAAAGPTGQVGPGLPVTPLGGARTPPDGPPAGSPVRQAEYDDEGRFDPAHGVLGLPDWITGPLTPVRPEDAPELIADAERILAAHAAAARAQKDPTP